MAAWKAWPDLTSPRARAWLRDHIAWREANAASAEAPGALAAEQTAAQKNDRAWERMSAEEKVVARALLNVLNGKRR